MAATTTKNSHDVTVVCPFNTHIHTFDSRASNLLVIHLNYCFVCSHLSNNDMSSSRHTYYSMQYAKKTHKKQLISVRPASNNIFDWLFFFCGWLVRWFFGLYICCFCVSIRIIFRFFPVILQCTIFGVNDSIHVRSLFPICLTGKKTRHYCILLPSITNNYNTEFNFMAKKRSRRNIVNSNCNAWLTKFKTVLWVWLFDERYATNETICSNFGICYRTFILCIFFHVVVTFGNSLEQSQ